MDTIVDRVFSSEGDSGISERGTEEIGAKVVIAETMPNKLFIFVLRKKEGEDFLQWLYECVYSGVC